MYFLFIFLFATIKYNVFFYSLYRCLFHAYRTFCFKILQWRLISTHCVIVIFLFIIFFFQENISICSQQWIINTLSINIQCVMRRNNITHTCVVQHYYKKYTDIKGLVRVWVHTVNDGKAAWKVCKSMNKLQIVKSPYSTGWRIRKW